MDDNTGIQNESVEKQDSFNWDDPTLFDKPYTGEPEQKEEQPKTEEPKDNEDVEVEDETAVEEESVIDKVSKGEKVLSKEEKFRREAQQFKDKYYATQEKLFEISERLLAIESGKQNQGQVPGSDEPDIEEAIREQWGDDPVLINLAKKYKDLEQKVAQTTNANAFKTAQTVYQTIEGFVSSNRKDLDNVEIGNAFIDEMNDRLPNGNFGEIVEMARLGKPFSPEFAETIKAKMERAYAVATGKGLKNKERQTSSNNRVDSRSKAPSAGVTPTKESAVQPKTRELTYEEAYRLAKTGKI